MATSKAPAPTAMYTAGYIRLTRDESLANGLSAPAQRKGIAEYAKRAGIDPVVLFEETKAVAGDSPFDSRPAGSKLVAAIRNGEINHLVVRDLDRLSRDILLSVELMDLLRENRVTIHTFSGPILLKSASDRFAYNVRSAASMFEKDQVSDRVTKAKRESVEQGRWPGGPPPIGYRTQAYHRTCLVRDGMEKDAATAQACAEFTIPAKLYIYEPEAVIIREIVRLSLAGMGSRRLVTELNKQGYRTRTGVYWSSERLRRTLANPAMAGYLTYDVDHEETGRVAPKYRQKLFKGNHEAIVSLEDWRKVRGLRKVNSDRMYNLAPNGGRTYLLTGILRCECGATMKGKSSSRKHRAGWYVCAKRYYFGPHAVNGCNLSQSSINAERVHEAFWPHMQALLSSPDLVERVYEQTQKILRDNQTSKAKVINFDAAIAKIETQLVTWYDRHDAATSDAAKEAAWTRIVDLTTQKNSYEHERKHQPIVATEASRITRQQIENYLASMFRLIEKHTPTEAKAFIASLATHHGLVVKICGPERLHVSLAVKSPGIVSSHVAEIGGDVDMPKDKVGRWVDAHRGKHLCTVCNKPVGIERRHFWRGIPEHHGLCWARALGRKRNNRVDGLLTQSGVARLLGKGETTISRWKRNGKMPKPFLHDRGTDLWSREQVINLL